MEEEYLATVNKGYAKGRKGKRGVDIVAKAFGTLVNLMEETEQDVLGDVFQGGVTYGEAGQFFTPDAIAELMAGLTVDENNTAETKGVCDPACRLGTVGGGPNRWAREGVE